MLADGSVYLFVFGAGIFAWSLMEYGIHGVLAHRLRTFVTPLHGRHHREPRAVFTSPLAWIPVAVSLWGFLALLVGAVWSGVFVIGTLLGFARYEVVHWRIHFREPRSERERVLRCHHLAHHYRRPNLYHGVTTRIWDRVFGTLPDSWLQDYAQVAGSRPLDGPSNLRAVYSGCIAAGRGRPNNNTRGEHLKWKKKVF